MQTKIKQSIRFSLTLTALWFLVGCTREIPPATVGVKFSGDTGISERLIKPQVVWLGLREKLIPRFRPNKPRFSV